MPTLPENPIGPAEHRRRTRALVEALYSYLTLDADHEEAAELQQAQTAAQYAERNRPTPEMLVEAQNEVDRVHAEIEANRARFQEALEHMPEEARPMVERMAEMALNMVSGPQLRFAEERVSAIQAALEKGTADATA